MRSHGGRAGAWALLVLLFSGCALRGPELTGHARVEYNEAVQQSGRRELLLNLVRLRYLEGPEFLAVGSIASQMRFDVGASLGGAFGDDQSLSSRLLTPRGDLGFSESPTITLTPRQDEAFTRRLVEPIAIDNLVALTRYGWSLERTLLVAVEDVNGVRNVSTREELGPNDMLAGERFATLARALQALYARRWVELDTVDDWARLEPEILQSGVTAADHLQAATNGYRLEYSATRSAYVLARPRRRYVLRFAPEAWASAEAAVVVEALGVPSGRAEYALEDRGDPGADAGTIRLRTRSVIGAMAYLSRGVAVPGADLELGLVPPSPPGRVPIRIASAFSAPQAAALAVRYFDRWFYVEAADFESRRTFGVLESLLRLQVGAGRAEDGPVLTLPVGR